MVVYFLLNTFFCSVLKIAIWELASSKIKITIFLHFQAPVRLSFFKKREHVFFLSCVVVGVICNLTSFHPQAISERPQHCDCDTNCSCVAMAWIGSRSHFTFSDTYYVYFAYILYSTSSLQKYVNSAHWKAMFIWFTKLKYEKVFFSSSHPFSRLHCSLWWHAMLLIKWKTKCTLFFFRTE